MRGWPGCGLRHGPDDLIVGQALCPYDDPGQVLFNAGASSLWGNLIDTVYHRLAVHSDERRGKVRKLLRVEYYKVAECQARGVVHFHAIARLDGPADREPAPLWASPEVLESAVRSAMATVSVALPLSGIGCCGSVLRWTCARSTWGRVMPDWMS